MKRILTAAALVVAVLAVPLVRAEDKIADVTDMQALRNAVKTDKRALVASTLQLTDAQGKKFWPAYEAYQRSVNMTNRRRAVAVEAQIARDRPISNLAAKTFASEMIATDEAEIKARRKLYNRVMRALPAGKAARYLQLEAKIRAVQDYDIASTFPLVR